MSTTHCFSFRLSIAGAFIAATLAWPVPGTVVSAQGPTLSVTILIVAETTACRPKGYDNYEDEITGTRSCVPLSPDYVDDLAFDSPHIDKIEIPPRRIPIGNLLPALGSYLEINPGKTLSSTKRQSAVFLFEWSEPQHFDASFQRVSSRPEIPTSKLKHFSMRGSRRWIHHERADSLLPTYRVRWVLATGDEAITLGMVGGTREP